MVCLRQWPHTKSLHKVVYTRSLCTILVYPCVRSVYTILAQSPCERSFGKSAAGDRYTRSLRNVSIGGLLRNTSLVKIPVRDLRPLHRYPKEISAQNLLKRSVSKRDLCTRSLRSLKQDLCSSSLPWTPSKISARDLWGKIPARDLHSRSLYETSKRGRSARSLYKLTT